MNVLRPATGVDDFGLAPIDRYVLGRTWIAFYRTEFSGVVFWGDIKGDDLRELAKLMPIRSKPPARPHPSLVDLRQLRSFDADTIQVRGEIYDVWVDAAAMVTRCAIIHPPGFVEAAVRGLRTLLAPPFEEEFFADPAAALDWLDRADELPLLDELEQLRNNALGLTSLLGRLRTLLEQPKRVRLEDAARALGMSERSLQRSLTDVGTSYQEELTLARVRKAQKQLLDGDATVSQVARAVGCTSAQHLGRLFQRVVGESPSRWRARQRGLPVT